MALLNLLLNLLAVLLQPECGWSYLLQSNAGDSHSICCPLGTTDSFPGRRGSAAMHVNRSCATSFALGICLIYKQKHSQRDADTEGKESCPPGFHFSSTLQTLKLKHE